MSRVLVLSEHRQGVLREVSREVLQAARSFPEAEVAGLLLGKGVETLARELAGYVPQVLCLESEEYAQYDPVVWTAVISDLVLREKFDAVVLPHSYYGMDLAGRLAVALDRPLITDVTRLEIREDRLLASRMVYGGRVEARVSCAVSGGVLLSVRPTAFPAAEELETPGKVETISTSPTVESKRIRFLEYVEEDAADVDITQAEIVVAVGRGIAEEENLAVVSELADALGGVLACSRPIVDRGWMPRSRQVGTSGRSIRPKVYLAVGISGAFQHVAGMKGAGRIIAINRDPHAPIFKTADYGVVGDLFEIIPALCKSIRERRPAD